MTQVVFREKQKYLTPILYLAVFLVIQLSFVKNVYSSNDIQLNFNHQRGIYSQPFQLTIESAGAGVSIYYTTDCSLPSINNGNLYSGPLFIDSTIVIKAVAVSQSETSVVYTQTYLFPETSARQGKSPQGFPATWGGSKTISADYEMDPEVINDPAYSGQIFDAFASLPSLSLTMDVDEWFNHQTGLYVGYPNTNETREKPVSAEFIFNNEEEENIWIECGVQNQGGTSIVNWKSPKQSMRLLFKEMYGPTRLHYKLFNDSEINSINTLVVDAMLNVTWIHPNEVQRKHALYLYDQLTSNLYNQMGRLSFHGRYFNLYLNGLYWGICDLHERPDDAFLSEYLDSEREDFDVLKHNPDNIVSGSNEFYLMMLDRAREGFSTNASLDNFKRYVDLPAFIDYMILNFYLGNYDWAHQNYYVARNRLNSKGFYFYPWDSELVMRFADVDYDNTTKNNEGGPTEVHTCLKENEEYRLMFADRVYKHMFNDGALTPENFEKSFIRLKSEIEKAIILESARWGDYREADTAITYTKNDYWTPEVENVLENYIPYRRDKVISQFRNSKNKLFPTVMPPEIQVTDGGNGKKEVKLIVPEGLAGSVYFTLDGKDPRITGGSIYGTKYEGELFIDKSTILKARYYSDQGSWSALAEEILVFDEVYGQGLVINEIMYHPEDDYPEFIEITNYGDEVIYLNGFNFSKGINYTFGLEDVIEPGKGIVLTNDNILFNHVYGFNAFGQYEKQLSNSGETLLLKNTYNQLVDSVTYSDTVPWPEKPDGDGYSLELISYDLDNALWSSWEAGDELHGTPFKPEEKIDFQVEMYPNPFTTKTYLYIDTPGYIGEEFIVEVFTSSGTRMKEIELTNYNSALEINLGSAAPGLYFIRIYSKNRSNPNNIVLKGVKVN